MFLLDVPVLHHFSELTDAACNYVVFVGVALADDAPEEGHDLVLEVDVKGVLAELGQAAELVRGHLVSGEGCDLGEVEFYVLLFHPPSHFVDDLVDLKAVV